MNDTTSPVLATELPPHALLARYRASGAFTDCYVVDVPRRVDPVEFFEAFLTTALFRLERRVLAVAMRRPSTDDEARRLATGVDGDRPFAAWTVEDRATRQLLLRDVGGRTRTWLMAEPLDDAATRLYLGSAVVPNGVGADGRPRMGGVFTALRGLHAVYSRALLGAARRRLLRPAPGDACEPPPAIDDAGLARERAAMPRPAATPGPAVPPHPASTPRPAALTRVAAGPSPERSPADGRRSRRRPRRDPTHEVPVRSEPAIEPTRAVADSAPRSPAHGASAGRRRGGPPYRARPTPEQIAAMPPFEALPIERILLIETPADADEALRALRAARTVGFDTESKPTFTRDAVNDGPHVIQFATRDHGFIVQVDARTPIDFLRAVLDSEDVVKVGFGLDSDRGPLERKLGLRLRGTIDVSDPLRRLGHKDALGAKAAVAVVLGRRLQKSKRVQTSNWGAPTLTDAQIVYAANDAYAALRVFEAMDQDSA